MACGDDGFPQNVRVRTEMNRNTVRFGYSLPIGAAKLIPIDLSLPAVRCQAEQKDNNRIDTGLCR